MNAQPATSSDLNDLAAAKGVEAESTSGDAALNMLYNVAYTSTVLAGIYFSVITLLN